MKPIDTKSWAEFKVGDLFEIENGKYVDPKTLTIDDNGSPYLRASIFNNGQDVDKYTGEGFKTKPNIISWGKQSPFFSYHTKACYTGQGIYWFKFDKGQNVAHFICTVLQRVGKNYNYQNCLTGAKLKHETIQLPVDQTGQPDWDYMEAFMEQINQQAQARLNEYKEGKLEYTTSDKIGYTPVDTKSWAEFKVGDLFNVRPTKAYKLNRHDLIDNGPNPVLANSSHNNGISGYTTLECTEKGGFISFSDTTSGGDTMFYQPVPVVGYSHVQGMFPIDVELNEYKAQYLISVIRAHLGGTWNYINKLTRKHMEKLKIQLPVDTNGQPDWNYMEAFMKQINQQAQAKLEKLEKGSI